MRALSIRFALPYIDDLLNHVQSSSIGSRIVTGTFWSFLGLVSSRVLAMLASILVARILGVKGFGELGIIQSTIGMFGVFAGFGLGTTATKYLAEFRGKDPVKAGRVLALSNLTAVVTGGVMALTLVLLGPWLAASSLNAPHLGGCLQIAAGFLFLSAINGAQTGALAGFEAFRKTAKVNLLAGLAAFPLMVAGAFWDGTRGAVMGLVASIAVTCILNQRALHSIVADAGIHPNYSDCWLERGILIKFSLPSMLAGSMIGPVYWFCTAVLVNKPGGYVEMGIFNAANQWFAIVMFLPGLLGQVLLPVLSESMGSGMIKLTRKATYLSFKVNALIVIPLIICCSLASPWIMEAYGPGFGGTWLTLVIVLLTAGILSMLAPIGQILVAGGRIWTGFAMNLGWAIAFYGLTMLLADRGANGLATARLIAYIFHTVLSFACVFRLLQYHKSNEAKQ